MTGRRAVMAPVWARDAALDRADLVGQGAGLGLVVRDQDKDRDRD